MNPPAIDTESMREGAAKLCREISRRLSGKMEYIVVIFLTVFFFALALWRIGDINYIYFDENGYVIDAKYLANLTIPPSLNAVPNPPLGKLLIGVSIRLLGDNAYGWRATPLIFSTLSIPLMYLLGRQIFRTRSGALLPPFLLTLDFMHFALARVAIIESVVVFLSLVMQIAFYSYYKYAREHRYKHSTKRLLLVAVITGLAVATKWPAAFCGAGFILIFLFITWKRFQFSYNERKWVNIALKPLLIASLSVLIATAIYFLTYLPYTIGGEAFGYTIYRQFDMLHGHIGPTGSYIYQSPWWSAPFISVPAIIFLVFSVEGANRQIAEIALMGNPAIWWSLLPITAASIFRVLRTRDEKLAYLLVTFLASWLPYFFVNRFIIYYFTLSATLGLFLIVYWFQVLWKYRVGRISIGVYLSLTAYLFFLFFPMISAQFIPFDQLKNLDWFQSWHFLPQLLLG